jgi:anti-sigma factor RsiW
LAADNLTCQELVELVSDYLEGSLAAHEHRRFEVHLVGCERCLIYVDQLRRTIELMGRIGTDDVPPGLLVAFRDWHAGAV